MVDMRQTQLSFQTVLDSSFRTHERKLLRYMTENVEVYRVNATFITPDTSNKEAVFTRLAFAILSANAKFDDSVKALNVVLDSKGDVTAEDIRPYQMVPRKAEYVNYIYHKIFTSGQGWYLRWPDEKWGDYRERLIQVKGLGRAKASFAACLLYPMDADLACVDTWIQKVFLGHTGFQSLSKSTYEQVESKIRVYARKFGISTFLAQWLIWDHARGGTVNSHAIFPGSHKGAI